jgi:hypothetical protein
MAKIRPIWSPWDVHLIFRLKCVFARFLIQQKVAQRYIKSEEKTYDTQRFRGSHPSPETWGRCYDHNFLRFSTIFGEKIALFLKNQCYDENFA